VATVKRVLAALVGLLLLAATVRGHWDSGADQQRILNALAGAVAGVMTVAVVHKRRGQPLNRASLLAAVFLGPVVFAGYGELSMSSATGVLARAAGTASILAAATAAIYYGLQGTLRVPAGNSLSRRNHGFAALLGVSLVISIAVLASVTWSSRPSIRGHWVGKLAQGRMLFDVTLSEADHRIVGTGSFVANDQTAEALSVTGVTSAPYVALTFQASHGGYPPLSYTGRFVGTTIIDGTLRGSSLDELRLILRKE
jgi:hypothetical protein